ncbi:hypothetical protein [Robertkochia flava]|nr:hypothetical protein [Robertkochia marina]
MKINEISCKGFRDVGIQGDGEMGMQGGRDADRHGMLRALPLTGKLAKT